MDNNNYFEILRNKNQKWFFQNENLKERLNALMKISERGNPSDIYSLIPFLKDSNKAIQNESCHTIIQLVTKLKSKNIYYDTLKHCNISITDIDLYEYTFSQEQFLQLLLIASLNSNGYVREKSVNKLSASNNGKAIQFIIYRLADWVQVVRESALQGINNFFKPSFVNAFVNNLPTLEQLQKVERINLSGVYNRIIQFILIENKAHVVKHFPSFSDKIRVLLAKQISNDLNITLSDIALLLSDKHFLIRYFALQHFEKLSQSQINNLLQDKSARIRIQVLYQLKTQNDFEELIYPFLTDTSASIRFFARFSLKQIIPDFAIIYNDNIVKNKAIIASIFGLAETNGRQFYSSIIPFLQHDNIRIKKAAFLASTKLNEQIAYDFAIKHLDSELVSIRNIAIDFLQKKLNTEVLAKAREVYKNGTLDLKKAMLKMFNHIGGWATITDLIIGTINEDENIRQLSVGYLQIWKRKAIRLFTTPKVDELESAKNIFNTTFNVHEDKKYFKQNPLQGLDFYLK